MIPVDAYASAGTRELLCAGMGSWTGIRWGERLTPERGNQMTYNMRSGVFCRALSHENPVGGSLISLLFSLMIHRQDSMNA